MIDTVFIDTFMKENSQYPKKPDDSNLWKSIKQGANDAGFPMSDADAQGYAKKHCNSMSFYALCKARGFIEFHYSTWFEKLLRAKLVDEDGFLGSKLKVAKVFGFDDRFTSLKYYESYDDCMNAVSLDSEKGYNIKVHANSGTGDHFMAGYVFNQRLYLSDSSSRGIMVEARMAIPKSKFQWLLEV